MITTATIPDTPTPSIVILRLGDTTLYAAANVTPSDAADMLRRALVHLLATNAGLATVPASAVLKAPPAPPPAPLPTNGTNPARSNGETVPPLRVPRDLPKTSVPTPAKRGRPRKEPDALDDLAAQAKRDTW